MKFSDLEDAYYTYGELNYRIGRMETDGNTSGKKYEKLVEERDYMRDSLPKWLATLQKVEV
jgi:hypothetical protein